MLLDCGVGDESWESLGLQEYPTGPSWGRSVLGVHWKDWCWGWSANTLVTWWDELAYLKRPWCWERLRAGGEGDNRRWDGRMVGWVWVNSKNLWWTGRPGMLQFMGSQGVRQLSDWTELSNTPITILCTSYIHDHGGKYKSQDFAEFRLWIQLLNFPLCFLIPLMSLEIKCHFGDMLIEIYYQFCKPKVF